MVQKYYYNRENYRIHKNCDRSTERVYLNSGFFMGRKRDVRDLLNVALTEVVLGEPKPRIEDQSLYQYIHATNKYPILVDCEFKLLYSPFSVCDNLYESDESAWKCAISENPQTRPIAIHSNGGICPSVCVCLEKIRQTGKLKDNVEKYDYFIMSYNTDKDVTSKYSFKDACGAHFNVEYPPQACNA